MWASWKRIWMIDDPQSVGARLVLKPAAEGLRLLEKEVREFSIDRTNPHLNQLARQDIESFEPDAILLANHPSSLFFQQIGVERVSCPVLVWLLDDPDLMGSEPFSPNEIVLVTDPRFQQGAKKRGARTIGFLPVAAPDRMQADFRPEYHVPVAYVGSIHVNREARAGIPPPMQTYLKRVIAYKVRFPQRMFEEILEEIPYKPDQKIVLSGPLNYYLYSEANRRYRMEFLLALVPFGLRLYGNEAWQEEIQGTGLQSCFVGRLNPFLEYPSLIRSAAITINLRSLQGFSAPTHRDFLVPRIGGFSIATASQSDVIQWENVDPSNRFHLKDFLWPFCCQTPEEMAQSAERFLADESSRREWIDEASRKISQFHTYSQRMAQLGNWLDSELEKS